MLTAANPPGRDACGQFLADGCVLIQKASHTSFYRSVSSIIRSRTSFGREPPSEVERNSRESSVADALPQLARCLEERGAKRAPAAVQLFVGARGMRQSADSVHEGSRGGRQVDEAHVFLGDAAVLALSGRNFVPPSRRDLCSCWEATSFCSTTSTTTLHKTAHFSQRRRPAAIFLTVADRFFDESVLGVAHKRGARAARARASDRVNHDACSNRRTHTGTRCLSETRFTRKANTVRLVIVLLLGRRCRNVVLSRACRGQDLNGTSCTSS